MNVFPLRHREAEIYKRPCAFHIRMPAIGIPQAPRISLFNAAKHGRNRVRTGAIVFASAACIIVTGTKAEPATPKKNTASSAAPMNDRGRRYLEYAAQQREERIIELEKTIRWATGALFKKEDVKIDLPTYIRESRKNLRELKKTQPYYYIPTLRLESIAVGQFGKLEYGGPGCLRVEQVATDGIVIVREELICGDGSSDGRRFWIEGINASDHAEGELFAYYGVLEVVGMQNYQTALGAAKSILKLVPLADNDILGFVRARIEGERQEQIDYWLANKGKLEVSVKSTKTEGRSGEARSYIVTIENSAERDAENVSVGLYSGKERKQRIKFTRIRAGKRQLRTIEWSTQDAPKARVLFIGTKLKAVELPKKSARGVR